MRNPRRSLHKLPKSRRLGRPVHKVLLQCLDQWPSLLDPARAILSGKEPGEFEEELLEKARSAVLAVLGGTTRTRRRHRTAPANTPIQASVLEAAGDDPDSSTLARWLDHGAPLGITERIETNGVFPPTEARDRLPPDQVDRRTLEGWRNYSSADGHRCATVGHRRGLSTTRPSRRLLLQPPPRRAPRKVWCRARTVQAQHAVGRASPFGSR